LLAARTAAVWSSVARAGVVEKRNAAQSAAPTEWSSDDFFMDRCEGEAAGVRGQGCIEKKPTAVEPE
jgi:hypothetical protein